MEINKVFLICCNDSNEGVVINDEMAATRILKILALEHFEKVKHNYSSYKEYRHVFLWRIEDLGGPLE